MYALSGVLTAAPAPEPGSTALLVTRLLTLAARRRIPEEGRFATAHGSKRRRGIEEVGGVGEPLSKRSRSNHTTPQPSPSLASLGVNL